MMNEQSADISSGVAEDPHEFILIRRRGEISPRCQQFLERLATKDNLGRGLALSIRHIRVLVVKLGVR